LEKEWFNRSNDYFEVRFKENKTLKKYSKSLESTTPRREKGPNTGEEFYELSTYSVMYSLERRIIPMILLSLMYI
jgi:hypothetical protein